MLGYNFYELKVEAKAAEAVMEGLVAEVSSTFWEEVVKGNHWLVGLMMGLEVEVKVEEVTVEVMVGAAGAPY
ncbi:MAG: hypothetical protein KL787_02775 [Taibaiella sp.]|nr:hypothetical protein [Taibaiella sp.]MBX9448694.1 hypothetical protein [Taibaiella sp.]